MTRRLTVVLVPFVLASLPACGGHDKAGPAAGPGAPSADAATVPSADSAPVTEGQAPVARVSVTLYFPSAAGDGLVTEAQEIVDTKRPADRGAQIIALLLDGPKTEAALPVFPPGTTLRNLWVRDNGNAYADFSEEFLGGAGGGSTEELLTVYAIVDSLTENVPAIRRVGILVAGSERDTFGHLDLSRPLPPDFTLATLAKTTE